MADNREFLPPDIERPPRKAETIAAAAVGFDYPITKVGVVGNITVYYDPALGSKGQTLATQLLDVVEPPYADMTTFFGIAGGAVSLVIAPLSGQNDGSGGAYHYGCDFSSGGVLYVDATFASTQNDPVELAVVLYVAELSEAFMGAQGQGWGCGSSNGEGLSRYFGEEETPPGSFPTWGLTGPSWASAGFPDWVTHTESTDRNYVSTGCSVVYLYWMNMLGFDDAQLTLAGGATLSANYQKLTGKSTAYQDLKAALTGLSVTSDNPFTPVPAGKWHHNDISSAAGAPAAEGIANGYMFPAQGTQHVVYRGTDEHIHELWWATDGWHHNDLSASTGAPPAASAPDGYMFVAQGTQHVVYRGTDEHIHELWWATDGWHHNDLTAAAGGAPAAVGNPSGYMFGAQGTQHVVYRGTDHHIHELWWATNGWHHNDLTAAAGGAPVAAGNPNGYMFVAQGTQHVVYRGSDEHIHELWWASNGWHHNDLTASTSAPLSAGNPNGYMFANQRTQHVVYRGTDQHVHELWWASDGWHHNDLTTAAAGAPTTAGAPNGYMFVAQDTQHVVYRGGDEHIHELWWATDGWHHNDLTAAAGGAPLATGNPNGYMFPAQGTQHVVYPGGDGHIHELWWG